MQKFLTDSPSDLRSPPASRYHPLDKATFSLQATLQDRLPDLSDGLHLDTHEVSRPPPKVQQLCESLDNMYGVFMACTVPVAWPSDSILGFCKPCINPLWYAGLPVLVFCIAGSLDKHLSVVVHTYTGQAQRQKTAEIRSWGQSVHSWA